MLEAHGTLAEDSGYGLRSDLCGGEGYALRLIRKRHEKGEVR